MPVVLLFSLF
ncbi:hypothetical protein M8494_08045 [Serratia ureilytica]